MTYGDRIGALHSGVGREHKRDAKEERAKWNIDEGNTIRTYKGVVKAKESLLKPVTKKR